MTTDATDPTNATETPEIENPVDDAVVEATAEVADEHQTLLHRFKLAGETGKKEWELALDKAREFFSQARDDAQGEGENAAKTAMDRLQSESGALFGRAQTRGADLLLRLITSVREGAQSLEKSLREARERAKDEGEAAVEAPAAA